MSNPRFSEWKSRIGSMVKPIATTSNVSVYTRESDNASPIPSHSVLMERDPTLAVNKIVSRQASAEWIVKVGDIWNKLCPHQQSGVLEIAKSNGIKGVWDEMGIGKGPMALVAVRGLMDPTKKLLFITTKSMLEKICQECIKWLEIDPNEITFFDKKSDFDPQRRIHVVNYDTAKILVKEGKICNEPNPYGAVILDEHHRLKNIDTDTFRLVNSVTSSIPIRLLLSGTPFSTPRDIFSAVHILAPRAFKDKQTFLERYCATEKVNRHRGYYTDYNGLKNAKELADILHRYLVIRRTKAEMKEYTAESLTPEEMRACLEEHARKDQWRKQPGSSTTTMTVDLTMAMSSGRTIHNQELPPKHRHRILIHSNRSNVLDCLPSNENTPPISVPFAPTGKRRVWYKERLFMQEWHRVNAQKIPIVFAMMRRKIQEYQQRPVFPKVVVFTQHRVVGRALSQFMATLGQHHIHIDGSMTGPIRTELLHKFQTQSDVHFALLSIKACGVGITLTEATEVIFTQLDFDVNVHLQGEDRCHRIGQTNVVNIEYWLVANSLEERVWFIIQNKHCDAMAIMTYRRKQDKDSPPPGLKDDMLTSVVQHVTLNESDFDPLIPLLPPEPKEQDFLIDECDVGAKRSPSPSPNPTLSPLDPLTFSSPSSPPPLKKHRGESASDFCLSSPESPLSPCQEQEQEPQ